MKISILNRTVRFQRFCRVATLICALLACSFSAAAQTFTVLHNFSGGVDGAFPYAGVTVDAAGGLYGTASEDGSGGGLGTVYKLSHRGNGWVLTTLYTFHDFNDGWVPQSRVVFGPGGALYGTTAAGGGQGYGSVFRLQPPPSICSAVTCEWTKVILHSFSNDPDGANPAPADLAFDSSGNIYGATSTGGDTGFTCANDSPCGAAYKLTRSGSGWSESVIYNFEGGSDGAFPNGTMLDSSGNLYGTTNFRGAGAGGGTIFALVPNGHGGFTENTLYSFQAADGGGPLGNVVSDGSNGLFGTTSYGGSGNGGTVWHLVNSGHGYTFNTLANFSFSGQLQGTPPGSTAVLTMDSAGNLYGTTVLDGAFGQGSVFKLSPSGGGWTLTTLHGFTGGADGGQPWGQVSLDAHGNLYGTASIGGNTVGGCSQGLGCGVVWEITP